MVLLATSEVDDEDVGVSSLVDDGGALLDVGGGADVDEGVSSFELVDDGAAGGGGDELDGTTGADERVEEEWVTTGGGTAGVVEDGVWSEHR